MGQQQSLEQSLRDRRDGYVKAEIDAVAHFNNPRNWTFGMPHWHKCAGYFSFKPNTYLICFEMQPISADRLHEIIGMLAPVEQGLITRADGRAGRYVCYVWNARLPGDLGPLQPLRNMFRKRQHEEVAAIAKHVRKQSNWDYYRAPFDEFRTVVHLAALTEGEATKALIAVFLEDDMEASIESKHGALICRWKPYPTPAAGS